MASARLSVRTEHGPCLVRFHRAYIVMIIQRINVCLCHQGFCEIWIYRGVMGTITSPPEVRGTVVTDFPHRGSHAHMVTRMPIVFLFNKVHTKSRVNRTCVRRPRIYYLPNTY